LSIQVLGLSTDYTTNVTEVKIEITENVGRVARVTDTLVVTIAGRHESINDELMNEVYDELEANGISPFPVDASID
jgi:hypothetical protein